MIDPALLEILKSNEYPDEEEIEAIVRLDNPQAQIADLRIITQFGPIATCRLRKSAILQVREEDEVLSLKAPRVLTPEIEPDEIGMAGALPVAALESDIRCPPGLSYTGKGVCIGIADWGIDITDPNLRHLDGSTRLLALWDQRAVPHKLDSSNPYGYGVIYTQADINCALRSSDPHAALGDYYAHVDRRKPGRHGHHVTDIAAGNGRNGGLIGVARDPYIIFVDLYNRGTKGLANLGSSNRIVEAYDFMDKRAGKRPLVVNLSVGNCGGSHDGCSLLERAFDYALNATPGRFICQSAGNYFNRSVHASGSLRIGEDRALTIMVDEADYTPNELEIWYSGKDSFAVRIQSPSGTSSPWVGLNENVDLLEDSRLVGRLYHRAHDSNNCDHHVDCFLYPSAPPGIWQVVVRALKSVDGSFHAWLERDDACPKCQTRFIEEDADPFYSTGTIANGRLPLVVGAYNAHSPSREIAHFSSCGPTRDNRCKPDLCAPGYQVLASRSSSQGWEINHEPWIRKSGTSMASPYVAGTAALCFQAAGRPLWASELRALILDHTDPPPANGQALLRYGRGYINITKAVEAASKLSPLAVSLSADHFGGLRTRHFTEERMEPYLDSHYFEFLDQVIEEPASRAVSEKSLLAQILRLNGLAFEPRDIDLDRLYHQLVSNSTTGKTQSIAKHFTVLARPGEAPISPLQMGDILLRVALGHPGLGHIAMITDPTLWPDEELSRATFGAELRQPGYYALVSEAGANPHPSSKPFLRRFFDRFKKAIRGQIVMRLKRLEDRSPSFDSSLRTSERGPRSDALLAWETQVEEVPEARIIETYDSLEEYSLAMPIAVEQESVHDPVIELEQENVELEANSPLNFCSPPHPKCNRQAGQCTCKQSTIEELAHIHYTDEGLYKGQHYFDFDRQETNVREAENLYPTSEIIYGEETERLDAEPFFEAEQSAAIPATISDFATTLGVEWSRRRNGKPSAEQISSWLIQDYLDTLEGARRRWPNHYNKGKYTVERISRAWMISRQENMKFQLSSSTGVKSLKNFNLPTDSVPLVSSSLIEGSEKAPVAPILVDFVQKLRQLYPGSLRVTTYRGHGGGRFTDRGYSVDLFLQDEDDRGFYRAEDALNLLRALHETAKITNTEWRVIYHDFSVAETINRETGYHHVIFVGKATKDKNNNVNGLIWHGPAPLILHFHLDLVPRAITQSQAVGVPSAHRAFTAAEMEFFDDSSSLTFTSSKDSVVEAVSANSTSKLPFLLAGPIVRRATPEKVWFWFACSREVKGCTPSIVAYQSNGKPLPETPLNLSLGNFQVVRLGENIWIVLVSAVPRFGEFLTDSVLGYDLNISTEENGVIKLTKLSDPDLKLDINYAPFSRPTFVIGKTNRRLVHGSCRRPGAPGEDASRIFDELLAKNATDGLFARPASLFLTGDQIYADDVALPLFRAVHQLAKDVFGNTEQMPTPSAQGLASADSYSWKKEQEETIVPGAGSHAAMPAVESGRKRLTHRRTSPIGFTTEDGEAHLLSFPEYVAMYLVVWNPELCRNYHVDDDTDPNLKGFERAVWGFRRILANTATYMLCDDHEITDDWNLDQHWEDTTKRSALARRIISNGLAAYWAFQAWGNDPDDFDASFVDAIKKHVEQLRVGKGNPGQSAQKFEETLLDRHWSFMAASNPKALCVDTRTRRETPKGEKPILSGKRVWPFLERLLKKHSFRKGENLLLVLPTPFLPHRSLMYIQEREYKNWPEQRYEGDYELYGNNSRQRAELVYWLHQNFGPSSLVIFSGDVHHGSVITGRYGYGPSLDKIKTGKADWVMRIVQITSSPIKNIKTAAYLKKRWWTAWQTDAGNVGESVVPQFEYQYATLSNGSYMAMQAFVRKLKGDLGRQTYIFENHYCVVEMPDIRGGNVKILFVGVKNAKLAHASIVVDTDNDPSKFRIVKFPRPGPRGIPMGYVERPAGPEQLPEYDLLKDQFSR